MARFRLFFGYPFGTPPGDISGTAAGTSTVAGILAGVLALSGTAAGTAGQTATLTGRGALAGAIAGTSTADGTVAGKGALAGTADGTSSVTGTLTGKAQGEVAGTAAGTSSASGWLSRSAGTGRYTDTREFIFQRLQAALRAMTPGTAVSFPYGFVGDPYLTDLGGRVYTRRRPSARIDSLETPYVEVFPSPTVRDTLTIQDGDTAEAQVRGVVVGYARADDAGDGLDSVVRPLLHDLAADLRLAVESAPYFDGDAKPAMATRLGRQLRLVVDAVEVVAGADGPYGAVVLEFSVYYSFRPRWP